MSVLPIVALLLQSGAAEASPAVPTPVRQAVTEALAVPGSRALVRDYQSSDACSAREARLERPVDGSGRYAVKVTGPSCQGWAWVVVEVRAPVSVTTRSIAKGESLDGAVMVQEREVRRSRAPVQIPVAARASRALAAGQMVEAPHLVTAGAAIGTSIKVIVRVGALSVAQSGRLVPCSRGRSCAVLPSGKHVTGDLVDGQLVVAGAP